MIRPKEVIKKGAGSTSPLRNSQAFYAVANGMTPGIHQYWQYEKPPGGRPVYIYLTSCSGKAEPEVKYVSGECHKRFRTLDQAEAFIEDWKETFADVYRGAIKDALDRGFRPNNMKLSTEGILHKSGEKTENTDIVDELNFGKLTIKQAEEQ